MNKPSIGDRVEATEFSGVKTGIQGFVRDIQEGVEYCYLVNWANKDFWTNERVEDLKIIN